MLASQLTVAQRHAIEKALVCADLEQLVNRGIIDALVEHPDGCVTVIYDEIQVLCIDPLGKQAHLGQATASEGRAARRAV